MLTIIIHGETGIAYNISSGKTNIHLKDFANLCASFCNREVVFDTPKESERKGYSLAMRSILSNERIINIGFEPKYNINDAIQRTIQILKS